MRRFVYYDLAGEHIVTEDEIVKEYQEYWEARMIAEGKKELLSHENMIEDWRIVHWAVEVFTD